MNRLYLLYGLSGFVTLGYQVAWHRIFVDRFGATNLTLAMVFCASITGLGVGSLASRRLITGIGNRLNISDGLRLYGICELLAAATVFSTFLLEFLPVALPGTLADASEGAPGITIFGHSLLFQITQVSTALFIFVPSCFMGATFPQLCRSFQEDARFPAGLHAWSLLGACGGALACQFVLLPGLGHDRLFYLLIAINVLIGVFFTASGGTAKEQRQHSSAEPMDTAGLGQSVEIPTDRPEERTGVLMACAVLGGLVAGMLAGDMVHRVDFLHFGSGTALSFVCFWTLLAIGLASWAVRSAARLTLTHIKWAFLSATVVYLSVWQWAGHIRSALLGGQVGPELGQLALLVGITVFPTLFLVSLLLPYVCIRLHGARHHLGPVCGVHTLAVAIGFVGSCWISPGVNVFYSFKLVPLCLVLGVVLVILMREGKPLRDWCLYVGAILFVFLTTQISGDFDPRMANLWSSASSYPVRSVASNGFQTTYVVEHPSGDVLYVNNRPTWSTDARSRQYSRLMAHFPLLTQTKPTKALLLSFGVGHTADAIRDHATIEQLHIVESNDQLLRSAGDFSEFNQNVCRDPRVGLFYDDPRHFLRVTDDKYDLIVSNTAPPMQAGQYRYYSREFYEDVRDHLTEYGVVAQWLPTYRMPAVATERLISTFLSVLDHAILIFGAGEDFILLGSQRPIDLAQITKRFKEQELVGTDLYRFQVYRSVSLLARVAAGDAALRKRFGGKQILSDQGNDLARMVFQSRSTSLLVYDPVTLLADIDADHLRDGDELAKIVLHLGRLSYHVYQLPVPGQELQIRDQPQGTVALATVDWPKIAQLGRQAGVEENEGKLDLASVSLQSALGISRDQPRLLVDLASLHARAGRKADAAGLLSHHCRIEANDGQIWSRLGAILAELGRHEEALPYLESAVEISGGQPDTLYNLAMFYYQNKQLEKAVDYLRESARMSSRPIRAYHGLGRVLMEQGKFGEAVDVYSRLLELDPQDRKARDNLAISQNNLVE